MWGEKLKDAGHSTSSVGVSTSLRGIHVEMPVRLRLRACQSKLRSRLFLTTAGACILLMPFEAASCHQLMQMVPLPRGRWQLRGWALVSPKGQKLYQTFKSHGARHSEPATTSVSMHLNVCHLESKTPESLQRHFHCEAWTIVGDMASCKWHSVSRNHFCARSKTFPPLAKAWPGHGRNFE